MIGMGDRQCCQHLGKELIGGGLEVTLLLPQRLLKETELRQRRGRLTSGWFGGERLLQRFCNGCTERICRFYTAIFYTAIFYIAIFYTAIFYTAISTLSLSAMHFPHPNARLTK